MIRSHRAESKELISLNTVSVSFNHLTTVFVSQLNMRSEIRSAGGLNRDTTLPPAGQTGYRRFCSFLPVIPVYAGRLFYKKVQIKDQESWFTHCITEQRAAELDVWWMMPTWAEASRGDPCENIQKGENHPLDLFKESFIRFTYVKDFLFDSV